MKSKYLKINPLLKPRHLQYYHSVSQRQASRLMQYYRDVTGKQMPTFQDFYNVNGVFPCPLFKPSWKP
jgi:hypothetical protein